MTQHVSLNFLDPQVLSLKLCIERFKLFLHVQLFADA